MSETVPYQNTSAGPARRLAAMSLLAIVAAVVVIYTLKLPWYHFSFSNAITVPDTYEQIDNVTGDLSITGQMLSSIDVSSTTMQKPIPVGPGGVITPVLLVLGSYALAILVSYTRLTILALGGLVTSYLAHGALQSVRDTMENPMYGGIYNTPQQGLAWFNLLLFFSFGLLAIIAFQSYLVNKREKADRRAAGEEIPASLLETMSSVKLDGIARIAGAAMGEVSNMKNETAEKTAEQKAKDKK